MEHHDEYIDERFSEQISRLKVYEEGMKARYQFEKERAIQELLEFITPSDVVDFNMWYWESVHPDGVPSVIEIEGGKWKTVGEVKKTYWSVSDEIQNMVGERVSDIDTVKAKILFIKSNVPRMPDREICEITGCSKSYAQSFSPIFGEGGEVVDVKFTDRIPKGVMESVYNRDGGKCVCCGGVSELHYHHIRPNSAGGSSTDMSNIALICSECHDWVHGGDANTADVIYDGTDEFWDVVAASNE